MYTDKALAIQRAHLLQQYVITEKPREPAMLPQLLNYPTEMNVRTKLVTGSMTERGLKGKFNGYWVALGNWITQQGGNWNLLSGRHQAGRTVGDVTSIPDKAMYDDAFAQTLSHINDRRFSVAKGIANHLRFIKHFKGVVLISVPLLLLSDASRRSIRYAKAGRHQGTHRLHKQNCPSDTHNRPTFAVCK